MYYYLFPFGFNNVFKQFADDEVIYYKQKGKDIRLISGLEKGFLLSGLTAEDRLYVVAHGNESVMAFNTNGGPTLTPIKLAVFMAKNKLRKDFLDIRLYSCFSGTFGRYTASFAQLFKEHMVNLGYSNLKVSGYDGKVNAGRGLPLKKGEFDFYNSKKKLIVPYESRYPIEFGYCGSKCDLAYRSRDFKLKYWIITCWVK